MYDEQKYPFAKEFREAHLSKIEQPAKIIERLLEWTKKPKNLLYFAGSVGCGKTYFSAAFYNFLKEKHDDLEKKESNRVKDLQKLHQEKASKIRKEKPEELLYYALPSISYNPPNWNIRYFTEYGLFSDLRKKISDGYDWESCLEIICDCTFLILDDMGASRLSEWQLDVLHTLIDLRVSNLQPTLITSNIFTKDLNNYFHPRVKSRICASRNTIIELDGEDKRQIIEKEAK